MAKRRLCRILTNILKSRDRTDRDDVMTDIFLGETAKSSSPSTSSDEPTNTSSASAINQSLELLFGGQETLSAVITCLVMLTAPRGRVDTDQDGSDQTVYDKMSDEVRRQLAATEDVEYDVINVRLDYVDAVVKEVLRLWPPIGGGYRRALKSFSVAVSGYRKFF